MTPELKVKDGNLLNLRACYDELFPTGQPSFRTFCLWRKNRYFAVVKVGRNVLLDPAKVRAELESRFTIPAAPISK